MQKLEKKYLLTRLFQYLMEKKLQLELHMLKVLKYLEKLKFKIKLKRFQYTDTKQRKMKEEHKDIDNHLLVQKSLKLKNKFGGITDVKVLYSQTGYNNNVCFVFCDIGIGIFPKNECRKNKEGYNKCYDDEYGEVFCDIDEPIDSSTTDENIDDSEEPSDSDSIE